MKPEEIRIAIAEACGWQPIDSFSYRTMSGLVVRDVLNDLNACHEALMQQDEAFKNRFEWTLNGIATEQDKYLVEMSAREWSEAFLETKGLWKDES